MTIETLGIDIAKNVFQLHGVNRNGRVALKRRVMRDQLLAVLAQIGPCTVVIEACTGAFYWPRLGLPLVNRPCSIRQQPGSLSGYEHQLNSRYRPILRLLDYAFQLRLMLLGCR